MKRLFDNLSDIEYVINNKKYIIKNIFNIDKIYKNIKKFDNPKYYFFYTISDGEKWESIAYKVYNDINSFWILILLNGIEDVYYDFILTYEELVKATLFKDEQNMSSQSSFDEAMDINDTKRQIKVLKPEYLQEFINSIKEN